MAVRTKAVRTIAGPGVGAIQHLRVDAAENMIAQGLAEAVGPDEKGPTPMEQMVADKAAAAKRKADQAAKERAEAEAAEAEKADKATSNKSDRKHSNKSS